MTHGFDTGFLVAAEVSAHPHHHSVRSCLNLLRLRSDRFALAPQVLAEFAHVVTDPKRFSRALTMEAALARSNAWWNSPDVDQVLPGEDSIACFYDWMFQHHLGRKRILDTLLAATYYRGGVVSLLTTDPRDFTVFGVFSFVLPINPDKPTPII